MSQTQKKLELNGRTITLVGTAHVSKESIEEVENTIKEIKPDCVAIELDEKRAASIQNPNKYSQLDIVKVLKRHEGFLMLANLILASFQRRMGLNAGVKPGDEMLAAIKVAKELNIPTSLVDRPIQITLKRAWGKNSFWGKIKLFALLLSSAFSKEEIEPEEVEKLKNNSEMDSMMGELSQYMPAIKEVLIDERDRYLAAKLYRCQGKRILAVLGAGHLAGVQKHLELFASGKESTDVSDIEKVSAGGKSMKIAVWLIPLFIIAMLAAGFYFGGVKTGRAMLGSWILWNGLLSALGTLFAGGHIFTILTAFIAAPLTSLCPFVGAGMVTGVVQAMVCKPKVSDMETLQEDMLSIKTIYKNRILRTLLVFLLSTIGSSVGTFVAGASFFSLSGFFSS